MSTRLRSAAIAATAMALLTACGHDVTAPAVVQSSSLAAAVAAPPVALEWQETARNLVASRGMSPLAAARLLAATNMAAMQAIAAVDARTQATFDTSGNGYGPGGRSRYEARRGAVAGASAKVLAWFVPSAAVDLDQLVAEQGSAGPGSTHPQFTRGVAIGHAAADAALAHVMTDGFTAAWTGTIPVGSGLWTTTSLPPAGATLGQVTPWFLTSGSQFRPVAPPEYLSPAFDADVAEVLAIRTDLTPAQLATALAWAYGTGTYTPVGYWNELASTYVAAAGVDEAAAATVFGLMSAAVFDALIAAFEAKYFYWTLRPHQANPAITTAFPVPNYPAYPSGHGSVSGASARVLAHFFPGRQAELTALVDEAAESRIYAGIHYRFDMTAARTLSEAVADWVIAHAP
jgi:membrane-associated phospholipid phosphatase